MSKAINEKLSFRQRGYDCSNCEFKTLTFGNDPEPTVCSNCGQATITKAWDHLVSTVTTVAPFITDVPTS